MRGSDAESNSGLICRDMSCKKMRGSEPESNAGLSPKLNLGLAKFRKVPTRNRTRVSHPRGTQSSELPDEDMKLSEVVPTFGFELMGFKKQAGPRSGSDLRPWRFCKHASWSVLNLQPWGLTPRKDRLHYLDCLSSQGLHFADMFSAVCNWKPTSRPSICRGQRACGRLQIASKQVAAVCSKSWNTTPHDTVRCCSSTAAHTCSCTGETHHMPVCSCMCTCVACARACVRAHMRACMHAMCASMHCSCVRVRVHVCALHVCTACMHCTVHACSQVKQTYVFTHHIHICICMYTEMHIDICVLQKWVQTHVQTCVQPCV